MATVAVILSSVALILLAAACEAISIPLGIEREQPRYEVVSEEEDYELREYKPGGSF